MTREPRDWEATVEGYAGDKLLAAPTLDAAWAQALEWAKDKVPFNANRNVRLHVVEYVGERNADALATIHALVGCDVDVWSYGSGWIVASGALAVVQHALPAAFVTVNGCGDLDVRMPNAEERMEYVELGKCVVTSVAFRFDGTRMYARKAAGESPATAVARSITRRIACPVELWWSGRGDSSGCGDTYTARWYDATTEVYKECEVQF